MNDGALWGIFIMVASFSFGAGMLIGYVLRGEREESIDAEMRRFERAQEALRCSRRQAW